MATHNAGIPIEFSTTTQEIISFMLVVNDFGIKYTNTDNLQHLFSAYREMYTTTVDLSGTLYCVLTIKRDYNTRHIDISMPGYIERMLHAFLEHAM